MTMTEVICWSMKRRIVSRMAGIEAAMYRYQGVPSTTNGMIQPRMSDLVGLIFNLTFKTSS